MLAVLAQLPVLTPLFLPARAWYRQVPACGHHGSIQQDRRQPNPQGPDHHPGECTGPRQVEGAVPFLHRPSTQQGPDSVAQGRQTPAVTAVLSP